MGEFLILVLSWFMVGWLVFDSTSVTIDADEITKLNSYCKVNQGVAKVKYTTDGKSRVTCVDGAIFEIKGNK